MFEGSLKWLQAHRLQSNFPEELKAYVRSEYGEKEADWFLVKQENGKANEVVVGNPVIKTRQAIPSA